MSNFFAAKQVERGFDEIKPLFEIITKGDRGFIAGSYAAYMAAHDFIIQPNDIDVFCASEESYESVWREVSKKLKMDTTNITPIARTLSPFDDSPIPIDVQIVRPHPTWKEFPDDIVNSFDLSISRCVLTDPGWVLADYDVGADEAKILAVNSPLKTLERVVKYAKRGVGFSQWELAKILRAWDELPQEKRTETLSNLTRPVSEADDDDDGDYIEYDSDYGEWYEDDDFWLGE